ncbi:MAG: SEC-C domain-containing protein [Acidobacteriia bacterium]|nr:SEC-C domain-containing protein [Terriglobia bacterium]
MPAAAAPAIDVIPIPEQYGEAGAYHLLKAASLGYIAFDHRLLHALLDDAGRTMPDILRFALENRGNDRVDVSMDLMRIFASHPDAAALPFLMNEIRRYPDDVPDEMSEALVRIGAPALHPLLALYAELDEDDRTEIPFLLVSLGLRDEGIEDILRQARTEAPEEEQFLREVYDGAAGERDLLEPFDIWRLYPDEEDPDLEHLPDRDRLEFLASPHPHHRSLAVESWIGEDLSPEQVDRLMELARNDPDAGVRGYCWEALGTQVEQDRVRKPMLERLRDSATPMLERVGLVNALIEIPEPGPVHEAVIACYQEPAVRARAMRAMVRSFDKSFTPYLVRHLEDEDIDVRRQSVLGVGFLDMHGETPALEKLFEHEELRTDALLAYALAAPGDTNRVEMRRLYERMEKLAGGFSEEDEMSAQAGIDLRLRMHGKATLFAQEEEEGHHTHATPREEKIGRNDPCPCGSGKKYKKCCGS